MICHLCISHMDMKIPGSYTADHSRCQKYIQIFFLFILLQNPYQICQSNVTDKKLTLKKGKTFKIKTSVTPITSPDKISYASSNKKIVTVNKKGKLKAVKKGTATITVKSGKKTVKFKVNVKK